MMALTHVPYAALLKKHGLVDLQLGRTHSLAIEIYAAYRGLSPQYIIFMIFLKRDIVNLHNIYRM